MSKKQKEEKEMGIMMKRKERKGKNVKKREGRR
jgi:hypothetical protein